MNKIAIFIFTLLLSGFCLNAQENEELDLLDLPGDNLDLYATLDLFQKSKTIEEFEKQLNDEETGINNLDLDMDGNVDFIKVSTKQEGDDFTFVLQIDLEKEETQDVAAIFVTKHDDGNISLQMVGDETLYGKDYVVEPKIEASGATVNPAYTGTDTVEIEAKPETVYVESEPVIQYIYSPVYVPYVPPYYWGYYPPYYHPWPIVSVHVYYSRHVYYRNRYYGPYRGGTTVVVRNSRTYNSYHNYRRTSTTVVHHRSTGSYKTHYNSVNRISTNNVNKNRSSKAPASKPNTQPAKKPSTSPAHKPSTQPAAKKPATRPASKPVRQRPASRPSGVRRPR